MASLLTAFFASCLFGNQFISFSGKWFRSQRREYTPSTHQGKNNTPIMGGLFVIVVVTGTILAWSDIANRFVWMVLCALWGYGAIGFWDDWCKIRYRKGISIAAKIFLQITFSFVLATLLVFWAGTSTVVALPFFKTILPNLGMFFIVWAMIVLIGTSNAVNLTDGLDGLAIGSLIINFVTFSAICYLAGHAIMAAYLGIPFGQSAELAVVGAALVGGSLGFLWYNAYPAQIFMGDIGSLSLGGALAVMALVSKQEFLLIISGGLFVLEAVSVLVQVFSYRLFGRRLFKMAPIHHHFELNGWQESKITTRFGIITFVLSLIALMTLKIR
jgi:phospho-N-acetylmuramoyl-pentapeptide-transferase